MNSRMAPAISQSWVLSFVVPKRELKFTLAILSVTLRRASGGNSAEKERCLLPPRETSLVMASKARSGGETAFQ